MELENLPVTRFSVKSCFLRRCFSYSLEMSHVSVLTRKVIRLIPSLLLLSGITRGNVLIFSHVGSHFHLASALAETLIDRGHSVTVVAPNFCFSGQNHRYNIIPYSVLKHEVEKNTRYFIDQITQSRFWPTHIPGIARAVAKGLLQHSDAILKKLRNFRFQIAIVDPALVDALLLVAELNLPHIMLSCSRHDVHLAKLSDTSLPVSYVPVGRRHDSFTHEMTFVQRVLNFWWYFYQTRVIKEKMDMIKELRDLYIPEMANMNTEVALKNTTLWIINSDFNIEFPYPVMPNVKYVGSLSAVPASRLPQDLKEFMANSGDNGVIVFSFSTILSLANTDIPGKFLEAFSTLPQRVIWRGETIQTYSDRILFTKWIPQNDVLGSPKTRVLVTHGGINGVQEAMYHGVPMVIVPVFGDQPDNAIRVEAHGYGVRLDIFNLTSASIAAAVKSVISDNRMTHRMKELSQKIKFERSHMNPREMAAYWVEHVIKYGHRYSRAANQDLSYLQLHGLDILAVIVSLCFVIVIALAKLCGMISKNFFRRLKSKVN